MHFGNEQYGIEQVYDVGSYPLHGLVIFIGIVFELIPVNIIGVITSIVCIMRKLPKFFSFLCYVFLTYFVLGIMVFIYKLFLL